MATSVFAAAAANALEWIEAHRRDFGTARRFRDDEILRIGVGMAPDPGIACASGRVCQWARTRPKPAPRDVSNGEHAKV
jgi:hypothetical protein